ncbi:MAG: nucleotidyltransferase domain-containing protein [Desulforhabdus sp.]|jgi:predicted nucleotidyltransferase|nr:nucleotidyltransferase domain-containing protein [Desulforhabdus sp.]
MELRIRKILEDREEILLAYLFGSWARHEQILQSDIDIAVYLDERADPLEAKLKLMGDLSAHLQRDDIDIVILNHAPLSLLGRILAHRKVILDRNPHLRHAFESLTIRKYHDFAIKEKALLERRFGFGR